MFFFVTWLSCPPLYLFPNTVAEGFDFSKEPIRVSEDAVPHQRRPKGPFPRASRQPIPKFIHSYPSAVRDGTVVTFVRIS